MQEIEKCIEILHRRTPMTANEELLLKLIENDIRLEFGLEGAVPLATLMPEDDTPPSAWFW